MSFAFNHERVLANVRQAATSDLLNRISFYRQGMEPEAIDIIEQELRSRGITPMDIEEHEAPMRDKVIWLEEGFAATCSFCYEPAVHHGWGWHRLFGRVPLFPRKYYYCQAHLPPVPPPLNEEPEEDSETSEEKWAK